MNDHPELYEIVQKVFNAGGKFQLDIELAMHNGSDLPAAYPVITPLIEELVAYVDEYVIDAQRYRRLRDRGKDMTVHVSVLVGNSMGINPQGERLDDIMDKIMSGAESLRPSSPFRSVEIVDGELK